MGYLNFNFFLWEKNYNPKQTNPRIIATLLASQVLVKNNIHDNTVYVKHLAQSLLLL